ncbi:hypothetical protein R3P38DRAFT_3371366 [Favolaschia claudopus]|uniref:Uncharacterized protein n=1 Tax=Favolaschia claudopus TaxID=2862362 RepID=A0AAV9ZXL7_9AGAR
MMVSSTPNGSMLATQAVWAGKGAGSLPTSDAEQMQEALNRGFIFSSAKSPKKGSHFSTFYTMKEWILKVIIPWLRGLVKMYDFFQSAEGRQIVQQAWRKCEVPGTAWNLSIDCLYGKDSEKALREYLREDQTLAVEIANRCGTARLSAFLAENPTALTEEEEGNFHTNDDSDVGLAILIKDALGVEVAAVEGSFSCNAPTTNLAALCDSNDGLVAADEGENMWFYTESGQRWCDVTEFDVESD